MSWKPDDEGFEGRYVGETMAYRKKKLLKIVGDPPSDTNPKRIVTEFTNTHEVRRHMDCASYNACLSYAFRADWPGFHCDECPRSKGFL